MRWVVVKEVRVVPHTVAVRVGCFGSVKREVVGVVPHTVVVRIGRFVGVVGEGVLSVEDTVAVRIHVADEHFIAHH